MGRVILIVFLSMCILGCVLAGQDGDLDTAATGYGPHGQVHISVHRGPTEKHGYHYFAPFSYYVRQPEDSHYGGYY